VNKTLQVIQEAQDYMRDRAFFNKLFGGENVLEDKMERYEKYIKPLLKTEGKVTAKQIKAVCGFNGSNVYGYLNELIDKGLLIKEADPKDGRKSYYKLPGTNSDREPAVADPDEKRGHGRAYAEPEPETFSTGTPNITLPRSEPAQSEDACSRLKTIILHDMMDTNDRGNCIKLHIYLLRAIQIHTAEEEEE
jgi:predicted transcriptional regulator